MLIFQLTFGFNVQNIFFLGSPIEILAIRFDSQMNRYYPFGVDIVETIRSRTFRSYVVQEIVEHLRSQSFQVSWDFMYIQIEKIWIYFNVL